MGRVPIGIGRQGNDCYRFPFTRCSWINICLMPLFDPTSYLTVFCLPSGSGHFVMSILSLLNGKAEDWLATQASDESHERFRSRSLRGHRRPDTTPFPRRLDYQPSRPGVPLPRGPRPQPARGGETWRTLFDRVENDLTVRQVAATAMGKQTGK